MVGAGLFVFANLQHFFVKTTKSNSLNESRIRGRELMMMKARNEASPKDVPCSSEVIVKQFHQEVKNGIYRA